MAPVHVYPLFESVLAARAGHDADGPAPAHGEAVRPVHRGGGRPPVRLVPRGADGRGDRHPVTRQPHRLRALHQADDGLPRLGPGRRARRSARLPRRAVPAWPTGRSSSGPEPRPSTSGRSPRAPTSGARLPSPRPGQPSSRRRPRQPGAGSASTTSTCSTSTRAFRAAVELAAEALGLATDDPRGLTVTGGLPYFGGPGNNYTTHGIATLTDLLRETGWRVHPARPGHRARVVRDQARPGRLRLDATPGWLPPRGHLGGPGRHRRLRRRGRHGVRDPGRRLGGGGNRRP